MARERTKWFIKYFLGDVEPIDEEPIDQENEFNLIEFIKEKFKSIKEKKVEEKHINSDRIYLNRENVIEIAKSEKCLKRSMYREAIDKGYNYGIIELYDFYTTLVKYNNNIYWYVKVLNGKYGIKNEDGFKKGYFNEYSNIRCLINATNGKYIYIDENFNIDEIRMINDDEFLKIALKFKNNK